MLQYGNWKVPLRNSRRFGLRNCRPSDGSFIESEVFEVVYGGARGGGKTDAALRRIRASRGKIRLGRSGAFWSDERAWR